jgi:hypothetical protein
MRDAPNEAPNPAVRRRRSGRSAVRDLDDVHAALARRSPGARGAGRPARRGGVRGAVGRCDTCARVGHLARRCGRDAVRAADRQRRHADRRRSWRRGCLRIVAASGRGQSARPRDAGRTDRGSGRTSRLPLGALPASRARCSGDARELRRGDLPDFLPRLRSCKCDRRCATSRRVHRPRQHRRIRARSPSPLRWRSWSRWPSSEPSWPARRSGATGALRPTQRRPDAI